MRTARRLAPGLLALVLTVVPAQADAPERSLRPVARGVTVEAPSPAPSLATRTVRQASALATLTSPRPRARPTGIVQQVRQRQQARMKGAVCNDPALQGETVGPVKGEISGCGIDEAVRLRSVAGVRLSQAALVDCPTAKALKRWVENGMTLSLRSKGPVREIRVAAHYACRPRNNQAGGRISEHGKGRAIDISGFEMKSGRVITVLEGWDHPDTRQAMRRMHRTACGVFGTVLGPDSDRFHRDHFHFDTAKYRNGAFCR